MICFWNSKDILCSSHVSSQWRSGQVLNIRWLKPVSTLSRDLVISRIDTTTFYHVTAMLWYHKKTSITAEQDAVIFVM